MGTERMDLGGDVGSNQMGTLAASAMLAASCRQLSTEVPGLVMAAEDSEKAASPLACAAIWQH